MATVQMTYATRTAITISPASIASSSTFVAGVESTEIDNSTNRYIDAILQGKITVGTTPTINTQIQIYVWGSDQSLATSALDVLDGTDSAETLTSVGIRNGLLKLAAVLDVDATTSNRVYLMGATSVRNLFGGVMPKFWGLFITHNTGVNLNATGGNHEMYYTGVEFDVA